MAAPVRTFRQTCAAVGRRLTSGRIGTVGLRVVFGVLAVYAGWLLVVWITTPNLGPAAGAGDHAIYMQAARRWLGGGSFYLPYQLAGPYVVAKVEILYPPIILPLLLCFNALPNVLWWIVPTAIQIAVVVAWRPSLLGWTAILGCIAVPSTFEIYAYGNPAMWIAAFVALGTFWAWPTVLVLLKPSLAPFALLGVRQRSWWIAAGVLGLVCLAFLPMWFDYAKVIQNARGPLVSPLYSIADVPLLLIPLIARLDRARRSERQRPEPRGLSSADAVGLPAAVGQDL